MGVIAVHCRTGGGGKTTLAVNLGWALAHLRNHRTLIWDLDPQATATFVLLPDTEQVSRFGAALAFDVGISQFVRQTLVSNLDLLPGDVSLRSISAIDGADRRGRLKIVVDQVRRSYSRIILDCPPGLTVVSDEVLAIADLVIAPIYPSAVALRGLVGLENQLRAMRGDSSMLMPVFTMVDPSRPSHRRFLEQFPQFPAIPLTDAVELMCSHKTAIGAIAPGSDAANAYSAVWAAAEARLGAAKVEPAITIMPTCAS